MSSINALSTAWWSWWSNPITGLHDTNRSAMLSALPMSQARPDFLRLLEMRSILNLPELPDSTLVDRPWLRCLALASVDDCLNHLRPLAALLLDANILRLKSVEWLEQLGVGTPEEIRDIIQMWNEAPSDVKHWSNSFLRTRTPLELKAWTLSHRVQVGLAVYLKSYYPLLCRRWLLTQPHETSLVLSVIEPLLDSHRERIEQWITPHLQRLAASIEPHFIEEIPELSLEGEDPFEEGLFHEFQVNGD